MNECYEVFSLLSVSRFDALAKRRTLTAALFFACVQAAEAAESAKELELECHIQILGGEKDSLHKELEAALAASHAELQGITSHATAQEAEVHRLQEQVTSLSTAHGAEVLRLEKALTCAQEELACASSRSQQAQQACPLSA